MNQQQDIINNNTDLDNKKMFRGSNQNEIEKSKHSFSKEHEISLPYSKDYDSFNMKDPDKSKISSENSEFLIKKSTVVIENHFFHKNSDPSILIDDYYHIIINFYDLHFNSITDESNRNIFQIPDDKLADGTQENCKENNEFNYSKF